MPSTMPYITDRIGMSKRPEDLSHGGKSQEDLSQRTQSKRKEGVIVRMLSVNFTIS